MGKYKFSVSICVYNGDNAEHFDTAMKSIFNQTLLPDEVVLVVDGPVNDKIESVISKYENEFDSLRVVRSKKNNGLGISRKKALEVAQNELIVLMDADDISVPDRFEKQINAFKNQPDISLVGGQITEFIDTEDNVVGIRRVPQNDKDIKEYMKERCPINHVSVMFKKSDIEKVGGYMDWYYNEDYYLWIRMALADMKFYNLPDVLVNVRVGNEMYQRRGGMKYFRSEAGIQKLMLSKGLISVPRYLLNVVQRFILQVLMPNKLRGFIFKMFARERGEK